MWREQNEKFYLKSLDHQGLLFKQTDMRALRSKALLNEIETLYDERHEQEETNGDGGNNSSGGAAGGSGGATTGVGVGNLQQASGPHMEFEYTDLTILEDANNLLIHHVKRQTGIHKEDKHKIKLLLRQFLLELFSQPKQEMSDDERDDDDDDDRADEKDDSSDKEGGKENGKQTTRSERVRKNRAEKEKKDKERAAADKAKKEKESEADAKLEAAAAAAVAAAMSASGRRTPPHARDQAQGETYSLIMANNNWYLFLRLHQILCERLTKMYNQAVIIANEESKDRGGRKESTSVALRLKPKSKNSFHFSFLFFLVLSLHFSFSPLYF